MYIRPLEPGDDGTRSGGVVVNFPQEPGGVNWYRQETRAFETVVDDLRLPVYETDKAAPKWFKKACSRGGICTCPNGQKYYVHDSCRRCSGFVHPRDVDAQGRSVRYFE